MAEDNRFSKYIVPIIFIIALIIVGIYAVAWLNTQAGQRQFENIKTGFAKYNPVSLLFGQIEETKRAVSWTAESDKSAPKQGIILDSFKSLSSKITAGNDMLLKYEITANIPDEYTVPTEFYCSIPSSGAEGQAIPPNPTRITNAKTPSVRCMFSGEQTETLAGPVKAEGGIRFPYETKDATLPVYFAREDAAEDFFDRFGIRESQPIRVQYNQEPVELAIGVSDENVQPVIVSEDSFPMIGIALHNRWEGKIRAITRFEIELPKGVTINEELTKNPTSICPFTFSKEEGGKNIYRGDASVLDDITIDGTEEFECWLRISPDMIPYDADYAKKDYSASVSYLYDTGTKTDVVTVE